jgi:hypothetical protein
LADLFAFMKLELIRLEFEGEATVGELRIDGEWFCWTLEDLVRAQKIKHQTAIPAGTYRVRLSRSQRFKEIMPEVLDVPGFSGIRIHPGSTAANTSGCILVGLNRQGDRITDSRTVYNALMRRLTGLKSGETVTLTITQPEAWAAWGQRVTVDVPAPEAAPVSRLQEAIQYSLDDLQPLTLPPTEINIPDPPGPASHPTDNPIAATVDSDRAWRTNLITWILSIGSGGYAWLRSDYRLLYLCGAVSGVVVVCWFVRSIILDRERIRLAADPNKYNVQ